MDFLHQDNLFKSRRQELRRNATPQEKILWKYLRRSNLGVKFERQHSIGPYIVDFYCPKCKLVIELDGSQHLDNKEYDIERTCYLESLGYTILRFWNSEVNTNIEGVLSIIKNHITQSRRLASPPILGGQES